MSFPLRTSLFYHSDASSSFHHLQSCFCFSNCNNSCKSPITSSMSLMFWFFLAVSFLSNIPEVMRISRCIHWRVKEITLLESQYAETFDMIKEN